MSEEKTYINFEIPEWVNWLARDSNGDVFGYRNEPTKGLLGWGIGEVSVSERNTWFITNDPEQYTFLEWEDKSPFLLREVDAITNEKVAINPSPTEPDMIQNDAPDMVNTPPHYKQYSFEPIDIITEVVKEYPPEIGFHVGTVLKYLFRSPFKGKQEEDVQKAAYYLARAIKELGE